VDVWVFIFLPYYVLYASSHTNAEVKTVTIRSVMLATAFLGTGGTIAENAPIYPVAQRLEKSL